MIAFKRELLRESPFNPYWQHFCPLEIFGEERVFVQTSLYLLGYCWLISQPCLPTCSPLLALEIGKETFRWQLTHLGLYIIVAWPLFLKPSYQSKPRALYLCVLTYTHSSGALRVVFSYVAPGFMLL